MAEQMTPAEKAQKEVDKKVEENQKLRLQIAEEQATLAQTVQLDSIQLNKDLVEDENARLKAQLEAARAAVKAQKESATPVEQAEAAAVEAAAAGTTDTDKKGQE